MPSKNVKRWKEEKISKEKMKVRVVQINSRDVHFVVGSVTLWVSKRSGLLKGKKLEVGDLFNLTLTKAKK